MSREGGDAAAPPPDAGGCLTVDPSAVAANWRTLAARVTGECGAAVKADGYGLGIETVVPPLLAAGCRTYFVAQLEEGRRVRALAPDATIYVLNGFAAGAGEAFAALRLRPVLNSEAEVDDWASFAASSGWRGGAALHVDTAMNRLGVAPGSAVDLGARIRNLVLVMSHFACSEVPDHPLNARQVEAFRAIRSQFPSVPASLANSSGLYLPGNSGCDLARPGYALYGGNPTPGEPNPMRCVATLEARILQLRAVEIGETIGYGATWSASRRSLIAILGVGYADGILRSGSSRPDGGASVAIAGRRCPVVGRISMDLTAVDVTDLPEGTALRGAFAEVFGATVGIDEAAHGFGTVGYELLTALGHRYHRRTLTD